MALTPSEKSAARRACGRGQSSSSLINYSKSQINAAIDAVDDKWQSSWSSDADAEIDATGFSFSSEQKKLIRQNWMALRAAKE